MGESAVGIEVAQFAITGMTCAACATRIEKGLNRIEGVSRATVNLTMESARVVFESDRVSAADIMGKVEQLGYKATPKERREETEARHRREIRRQRGKLAVSALLSLPLLWAMAAHFSFTSWLWVPDLFMNPWFQLALATPVQFVIGRPFYAGAYKALRSGGANMDVLVALGTSAAYFYSLYLSIDSIGDHHRAELYYETSALLITLIVTGKLLEMTAKGRSSDAIMKLLVLQAKTALVERDGVLVGVPIDAVAHGDVVFVKPGEKVPVDGVVLEGVSSIDESMLTGESVPVDKAEGANVYGGTMNRSGSLRVRATNVGEDSALSRIVRAVEEAQGAKAPIQRVADRISGVFVPIVVGIALATFLIAYFAAVPGDFSHALELTIAVLVIACPCALGLATPTSIMAGSGRAAEHGILFKNGQSLEQTHRIDTVVLDKTGTVTIGKPVLTDVELAVSPEWTREQLLVWIASAESHSEHPLAEAIVVGIEEEIGAARIAVDRFEAIPGHGVRATVQGRALLIGTRKLMADNGIEIGTAAEESLRRLEAEGKTSMLVAADDRFAGIVAVADTIKPTSREAIERLRELGLRVILLTGDNARVARAIADQAGIGEVVAEVLPNGKAEAIRRLQAEGRKAAMVGDGLNDAPALASADVGMAIGTGTDIAIAAADVTLLRGDLNAIADAIFMSRKTMQNIKQNLFWALGYNVIGIPIAASGYLAPWLAGAAMALSSVSVVLNALRLQKVKPNR
ncbi:heavy metal translocating P-type ATPase [Cohnella sp. GCM10027633]|uniref:heavy metal translocating P-type ATPase n=1 Tax=unclassified Cohnella TaxID=2636738 RepID=UPI00363701B8